MIKFNKELTPEGKEYITANVMLRCKLLGILLDENSTDSGVFVNIPFHSESYIQVSVYNLDKSVLLFSWVDNLYWV